MSAPTERYRPSDDQHCRDLTQPNAHYETAWRLLIDQLTGFARTHTFGFGFSTDEFDELMLATVATFLERISDGSYRCIGYKPATYACTIFKNLAYASLRRRGQQAGTDIADLEADDTDNGETLDSRPAAPLLSAEPMSDDDCRQQALEKAMAPLKPDERDLLLLTVEIKEHAEATGQDYQYLRVKKHRIMNRLKPIVWGYYTNCIQA